MPSIHERLSTLEANVSRNTEILERVETYITTDRVELEHRITNVENKVTFRSWIGGAAVALPQLAQLLHGLIPGLPLLPPGPHSA